MKITLPTNSARLKASHGFGLVEALFGMGMAGIVVAALYAGLAFGFNTIKFARENTRATQIMVEKMETIRLYTWSEITSNNFIPTNKFVVPYYAVGKSTNTTTLMYTGQIFITSPNLGTTYNGNMKQIAIQLNWITGKTARSRKMTTYVARNGMQTYVY
jgi:hypothetical protein